MKTKQVLGRFIVADPKICHGKLTFKGTRVLVEDVLEMVSQGYGFDYIITQFNNSITKDAISEVISLGKESLLMRMKAA